MKVQLAFAVDSHLHRLEPVETDTETSRQEPKLLTAADSL